MEYYDEPDNSREYSEEEMKEVINAGRYRLQAVLSSIPLTPEVIGRILDDTFSDFGTIAILLDTFQLSEQCLKVIAQKYTDGRHNHLHKSPINEYHSDRWDRQENNSANVMRILANSTDSHAKIVAAYSPVTDEATLRMLARDRFKHISEIAIEQLKKRRIK